MDTNQVAQQVARSVGDHISAAGETHLGIAEATGIPRSTLMRRLAGTTPFTVAELAAIAATLGLPDFLELLSPPRSEATRKAAS